MEEEERRRMKSLVPIDDDDCDTIKDMNKTNFKSFHGSDSYKQKSSHTEKTTNMSKVMLTLC